MIRLRVLWVGRTQKGFVQEGVAHYLKRIAPLEPIECIDIKAARHSGRDSEQALRTEGDAILKRLGPGETAALLDESGKTLDSAQFAGWLERLERGRVTFIVGGGYGVSRDLRSRVDETLSLSRLTLPHQLVRIVLLEQIYRALTLRAGHGYHHG